MNPRRLIARGKFNPRAKFLMLKGVIGEKDAIFITKIIRGDDKELSDLGMLMLNEHWKNYWGYDKYTKKYRKRREVRF